MKYKLGMSIGGALVIYSYVGPGLPLPVSFLMYILGLLIALASFFLYLRQDTNPTKPKLVAMVDISGSTPQTTLLSVGRLLRKYSKSFDVVVVEYNLTITATYKFEGQLNAVQTYGKSVSWSVVLPEALKLNPTMVLMVTDGWSPDDYQIPNLDIPVLMYSTDEVFEGLIPGITRIRSEEWV